MSKRYEAIRETLARAQREDDPWQTHIEHVRHVIAHALALPPVVVSMTEIEVPIAAPKDPISMAPHSATAMATPAHIRMVGHATLRALLEPLLVETWLAWPDPEDARFDDEES
jgi:hypothetical protein